MISSARCERALSTAPPCIDCNRAGHYCPGIIPIADGGHLCIPCDDGVPCGRAGATAPGPDSERVLHVPAAEPIDLAAETLQEQTAKASLQAARILGRRRGHPQKGSHKVNINAAKKRRIVRLLAMDKSPSQIAEDLEININTILAIQRERGAAKVIRAAEGAQTSVDQRWPEDTEAPASNPPAQIPADPPAPAPERAFEVVIAQLESENRLLEAQISSNRILIDQLAKAMLRRSVNRAPAPQPEQEIACAQA